MRPLLLSIGFLFCAHVHAGTTEQLRTLGEAFSKCDMRTITTIDFGPYEQLKSTRKVLVSQADIGSCPSYLLIHQENEEIVAPVVGSKIRNVGNQSADEPEKKEVTCSYRIPTNRFWGQAFRIQFSDGNFQCVLSEKPKLENPTPVNATPTKKRR